MSLTHLDLSLTLWNTHTHSRTHTHFWCASLSFYRRWELKFHFALCLFWEFLTVGVLVFTSVAATYRTCSKGEGWQADCLVISKCVCVRAGWRDRGALLSIRDNKGPQRSCGVQRTNAIVSASQVVTHRPTAYVAEFKQSCSLPLCESLLIHSVQNAEHF